MRVLSWDVGIVNLPYCLMEVNDTEKEEDKRIEIIKWDIFNLINDRKTCNYKLKNDKICNKIASFNVYVNINETTYTCKNHVEKYKLNIIDTDKHKCIYGKCKNNSIVSICDNDNYAWCEKHKEYLNKTLATYKPKKIKSQNSSKQDMSIIIDKLCSLLDSEPLFLTADVIIIENQPSYKQPQMKTIEIVIYTYFVTKFKTLNRNIKLHFVSPSNKLRVYKEKTDEILKQAKNKDETYTLTKSLGKVYCKNLISENELKMLEDIKNNKTKNSSIKQKDDDLCDAYLQGFKYIFDDIPEYYKNKLKNITPDKFDIKTIKSKKT